jgi:uncharacterized coiled-coil protein SlyX
MPKFGKIEKLEATLAQQQKQIETLTAQLRTQSETFTAQLKEQATKIQKVSAQLEVSKPAPQVVNNPSSRVWPNETAVFHNQPSRFTVWRLFVSL